MIPLKYSTASQEIPLGPFVDETDGITPQTGLSIANTDILLWKNGNTSLVTKNSGGATHINGGVYYAVLDATDTDTFGPLEVIVLLSGSLPVKAHCWVMEADAYSALFGASGSGHIDASVNATEVASGVLNALLSSYTVSGSVGEAIGKIGSIDTAIASGGVAIATSTMQLIAAEILKYGVDNVENSADANSVAALILATFFSEISGTDFNVYKTDGATLFATTTVVTDDTAKPIVSVGI